MSTMLIQTADSKKRQAPSQEVFLAESLRLVHQLQPDGCTCVPTSVAILAGVPVDEILSEARRYFRAPDVPWDVLRDSVGPYEFVAWRTDVWLLNHFFGSDIAREYIKRQGDWLFGRGTTSSELTELPEGRGILQIINGHVGHCVAYADGSVYDPDLPGPLPFRKWRGIPTFRSWRISVVLPVHHNH